MNLISLLLFFLAERRERRDAAESKAKEAKNKIRTNYLKMLAIQQLRGETSSVISFEITVFH